VCLSCPRPYTTYFSLFVLKVPLNTSQPANQPSLAMIFPCVDAICFAPGRASTTFTFMLTSLFFHRTIQVRLCRLKVSQRTFGIDESDSYGLDAGKLWNGIWLAKDLAPAVHKVDLTSPMVDRGKIMWSNRSRYYVILLDISWCQTSLRLGCRHFNPFLVL